MSSRNAGQAQEPARTSLHREGHRVSGSRSRACSSRSRTRRVVAPTSRFGEFVHGDEEAMRSRVRVSTRATSHLRHPRPRQEPRRLQPGAHPGGRLDDRRRHHHASGRPRPLRSPVASTTRSATSSCSRPTTASSSPACRRRPSASRSGKPGNLRITSYNVENLFDLIDNPNKAGRAPDRSRGRERGGSAIRRPRPWTRNGHGRRSRAG